MAGQVYSTLADLKRHWSALPSDKETDAEQKLEEASIEVRSLYRDTDERIATGALDADAVRLVVNRMVKRALDTSDEELAGVTSATAQTGPFSQTLNYSNPDASMYMTKADKRLLESGRTRGQAWTIHPNPGR